MGPANRREREKQALRAKIMDAARTLFAEKGYEAVTMRMVAEAIEYSPRTIYLHFKDKEELIRELCMQDFRIFGEGMANLAKIPDPIERLRAMGRAYVGFSKENPHHFRVMFMTSHPLDAGKKDTVDWAGDPTVDAYAFMVGSVREAIALGRVKPTFHDAELVAQTLWASIHGVAVLELTHGQDDWVDWRPLAVRVEALLDFITQGYVDPASQPLTRPATVAEVHPKAKASKTRRA